MVDNEKVKKAFDECWEKNGGIWYADIYKDDLKQIAKWFLMSGYSARDKEAEEEKQELIEGLLTAWKEKNRYIEQCVHDNFGYAPPDNIYFDNALDARDYYQALIKKHTGKPIDEVIG